MKAEDLPEGSVVATWNKVWLKTLPSSYSDWRTTQGSFEHNVFVDEALATGAEVLRYGYGNEAVKP